MKKLASEPLVQFLLGALLLFAYFDLFDPQIAEENEILINKSNLSQRWQQAWRRPPSEDELLGLVDEAVRDEILYREALKLGMDQDDAVVRNRLVQKMQFLHDQDLVQPSQAQLEAWLEEQPNKYTTPAQYSFEQEYLGEPEQFDGSMNAEQIEQAVANKPSQLLGVANRFEMSEHSDIERQFGGEFAQAISGLSTDVWHAPVYSGFGAHAVRITKIKPSQQADLTRLSVRKSVENDWLNAERKRLQTEKLQQLLNDYQVTITE